MRSSLAYLFCRRDADGHERWSLELAGKSDKKGLVSASAKIMVELRRCRRERSLSILPSRHEDTPLVLPLGKFMKVRTRAALHTIAKSNLAGAAERLRLRGGEHAGQAALLEQASAHWLRHTAGVAHGRWQRGDLPTVRDNIRHPSRLADRYQCLPAHSQRKAPARTEEKHRIN